MKSYFLTFKLTIAYGLKVAYFNETLKRSKLQKSVSAEVTSSVILDNNRPNSYLASFYK